MDRFTGALGQTLRWLPLAMALGTVVVVALRYVLQEGSIALQEAVIYAHVVTVLLGIAYTLREDGHVRVDLFYTQYSRRAARRVNLLGHWLFLIPVSLMLIWVCVPYAQQSWRVFEGSSEVGGLPGLFLLKTLLPTSAVYLLLQGIAEAIRQFLHLELSARS